MGLSAVPKRFTTAALRLSAASLRLTGTAKSLMGTGLGLLRVALSLTASPAIVAPWADSFADTSLRPVATLLGVGGDAFAFAGAPLGEGGTPLAFLVARIALARAMAPPMAHCVSDATSETTSQHALRSAPRRVAPAPVRGAGTAPGCHAIAFSDSDRARGRPFHPISAS
jgi:hypothetical protein